MVTKYGNPLLLSMLVFLSLLLAACNPSDDSSDDPSTSVEATLSDLDTGQIQLDQVFQTSQTSYTATVGNLIDELSTTLIIEGTGVTVSINGTLYVIGSGAYTLPLAVGENIVTITITSEADASVSQTYTITIIREAQVSSGDSVFVQPTEVSENDTFGRSLAFDGTTLIVGANLEDSATNGLGETNVQSGAAYVFILDNGSWIEQQKLKGNDTGVGDSLGTSVAIDGDTAVVGAPSEDNGPSNSGTASGSGAAYVFIRTNDIWTQQAKLKASDALDNNEFGVSVAIDGDTIVVGASLESSDSSGSGTSANEAGAAYVFTRTGTAWTQVEKLKADNAGLLDNFGASVAVEGTTIAIGAPNEGTNTVGATDATSSAGAVYVYTNDGSGWEQDAMLKSTVAGQFDNFGTSVAIEGDAMVIGAPAATLESTITQTGVNRAGNAYVFRQQDGVWAQEAQLNAQDPDSLDEFGTSVSIDAGKVAIGSYLEDSDSLGSETTASEDSGAVYVFEQSGDIWQQTYKLKVSNGAIDDYLGYSVGISNGVIAAGAYLRDAPTDDEGAVYIWE